MHILNEKGEGSCFIEFLPGKYKGKCWNEESIFLSEEDFAFILYCIEKGYQKFDYYSFNEIQSKDWLKILIEIDRVIAFVKDSFELSKISEYFHFTYQYQFDEYCEDFERLNNKLILFFIEFKNWVKTTLKTYNEISILGM